jgi:EAL domain-containing protein (putative c-di-GMP-specific phosphodiesterase class I)
MGIAFSAQGYDRPEDILRDADAAMYKAKTAGKARHELFDVKMHTRALQALTVENELREALEHGEIRPYYQPIVSLVTGEIVGFEALARWFHPERGLISPADFIPLAEDSGLIVPIGQLILKQACEQTAEWQSRFDRPELSISVNLSAKQFRQSLLISEVREILHESGLRNGTLKLEVTETMVIEDLVAAVEMLSQLRKLGVQISIDDFGTGYSSLSYLHRFAFDFLKIDRSFISRMTKDKESLGIVKTITTLANELSKSVIAEGVETIQQRRILSLIGCQYAQGFLFSRAVDADEAGDLIEMGQDWVDVGHHSLSNFHIPSRTIEASREM